MNNISIIQWSGEILDHISTPIAYMDYSFRTIRVNQAFADFHHKPISFFSDRSYFAIDPHTQREKTFRDAVYRWQQADFPEGMHTQCGYWRLSSLRNHAGECSGLLLSMEPSLPKSELGIPDPIRELSNRHTRKFSHFNLREQGVIFKTQVSGHIDISEGDCFALPEFTHGLATGRNIFDLFQAYPELSHALYRASEGSVVRETLFVRDSQLDLFLSPYYDDSGQINGMIGVAIDGSERKQYEQRLIHAKDFLTCLMDSIPDLICYKDENGTYLGCNYAFSAFVGASKKHILGKKDTVFFGQQRVERLFHLHQRVIQSGKPYTLSDEGQDASGQTHKLETTEAPVYQGDKMVASVSISRKLKHRKQ